MTKQTPAKKTSKADKQAAAAERAAPQAATATKKTVKLKGIRPMTYAPNKERETARLLQQTAEARNLRAAQAARMEADLVCMQARYADLVAGIPGEYDVGFIDGNELIFESYNVGKTECDTVGIFGFRNVFVPLAYLFFAPEEITILNGWQGEIQVKMLDFLRKQLAPEIKKILEERYSAAEEAKAAAAAPKPKLATVDGKAVKPTQDKVVLAMLPLVKFTVDTVGRFDFSSGQRHCMVVQQPVDGKMTIKVTNIDEDHPLAAEGVRVGLWLRSQSIENGIPDAAREHGEEFFAHVKLLRNFIVAKLAAKVAKQKTTMAEPAVEQAVA